MVAGTGDAEHGGGTGATLLEERVRRLEKDVEELLEQVRTHSQAQTQVRAIAETQNGVHVDTPEETPGEAATPTEERPAQREIVSSPFAEATRNAVRHRGGNARERGPLLGLFPDGLPSATWWVARAGVVLLLVGVSFLLRMGVEQGWLTPAVRVAGGLVIGGSLCLRAACQNLPSRLLAIARGRRCRGVLPFRLRRVERVAIGKPLWRPPRLPRCGDGACPPRRLCHGC
jgi:uncharacterized membrane protein